MVSHDGKQAGIMTGFNLGGGYLEAGCRPAGARRWAYVCIAKLRTPKRKFSASPEGVP
jgi:hypothetical protein